LKGDFQRRNDALTEQRQKILDQFSAGSHSRNDVNNPNVPATPSLPTEARSRLKEGTNTTFGNGQTWTLKNGQPVQVK